MKKYFLPIFLLLFFFSSQSALGANDAAINSTTQGQQPAQDSGLTITVDQYSENVPVETVDSWISHKNSFSISSNIISEFENTNYCPINKIFCELTLTKSQTEHLHLSSGISVDTQAVQNYLNDLATKVNRDPEDAKFSVIDGKVTTFSQAQNGVSLNIPKSLETISQTLSSGNFQNQTISLPFDAQKTNTDYADINNLGISSLLGEGTSNFKGSPANRVHNINVAAAKFNGILIKPGEEFSFIKNLGQVDDTTGYLPELVIKGNLTEPEFGGGICQVSTTAFRAAIYSGLKITDRRNHAYPVSYYNPQGMDSTVYIPNPDLRFVNNTPGYILIQTKIVGTILTFDFYGTDDGRKTTIDGPYITDKQPDGSMKAHFTQHVTDKNGNEFINDVFNSTYNSPYLYPHPGATPLAIKPANWSVVQWKNYQQMIKDQAKAAQAK